MDAASTGSVSRKSSMTSISSDESPSPQSRRGSTLKSKTEPASPKNVKVTLDLKMDKLVKMYPKLGKMDEGERHEYLMTKLSALVEKDGEMFSQCIEQRRASFENDGDR
eukprot:GFYU01003884.1.p1 GENE.GFYU01003884.1~~GFYU01003884.1.p1  ORF type:complete len:109 (-),score=3.13 GFYU01003884.1:63-389(-)